MDFHGDDERLWSVEALRFKEETDGSGFESQRPHFFFFVIFINGQDAVS